jgi:hypothetical protein
MLTLQLEMSLTLLLSSIHPKFWQRLNIIFYHIPHIQEDIIRFGPVVGLATEGFELFNAIFQYCSILSNSLAPSRDIAYQLANQESLKHVLCGGWWTSVDGEWTQPGLAI